MGTCLNSGSDAVRELCAAKVYVDKVGVLALLNSAVNMMCAYCCRTVNGLFAEGSVATCGLGHSKKIKTYSCLIGRA